jgi:hypothetical protein
MRAGLVFSRMRYSLCVRLLEEGENAGGRLVGRLMKECYNVLCAVLER